ncbi:MAG: Macoilin family protein [Bacteriophage sp.]|nr:MAG: Macoilin family protein [Bacteriophage sp.]
MADKPVGNMKFGIGFDGLDDSLNTLDKLNRAIKQTESAMKTNISTMDKANKTAEDYARQEEDLAAIFELQAKKIKLLEQRKEKQIKQYGAESAAVAKTNAEINKASTKYNQYSRELDKSGQAYIIASSGVDKHTKALASNEKAMKEEVSALKGAGDKVGAYKAQKKGLETQEKLTSKAIAAQENVVKVLTKEYGANSKQVLDAKDKLEGFKRQQNITSKQIEGTNKQLQEASNSFKGLNKEMKDSQPASTKAVKSLGKVSSGLVTMLGGIGKVVGKVGLGALLTVGNKAFNAVSSNIDSAIKRIDTLNNSTKAFENMGFSAENTAKAMGNISKAIEGLPTPLQDSVSNVQLLAASTGDLDKSVDVYKALNDAILGFGGDANMAQNAIVQLSQAFSNGKVDASTWNSMIDSGLGPTLNALAKQMGKTTGELKEGLSKGNISVKDFQDGLIKLDKEGGGGLKSLEQIAKDSTKGIGTSLANMKTAMVRGTAELIKSFDEVLKNLNLPSISEFITNSGKNMEAVMKKVAAAAPEVAKNFEWVGDVFNGLKDIFANVLDEVDAFIFNFKNGFTQLLDFIKTVWNGDAQSNDYYLLRLAGLDYETIWKLEDFIKSFKEKVDVFGSYVKGFWKLFSNNEATSLQGYSMLRTLGMTEDQITGLETAVENTKKFLGSLKDVILELADIALFNLNQEFNMLYKFFTEEVAPDILPIVQSWTDSFDRMSKMFDTTGQSVDGFKTTAVIAWKVMEDRFVGLWKIITFIMSAIQITIEVGAALIAGTFQTLGLLLTGKWSEAWERIKKTGEDVWTAIWVKIKDTFLGKIITTMGEFYEKNKKLFEGIWNTATGILFALPQFVFDIFTKLPKRMAEAIKGGKNVVVEAFKGVFNAALKAIGKPVNGIIKGASWVLEKLGAEPLKEWDVPQYANGTPEGGHPINGPMMVNDGRGAETVITPDGRAFIPKGRNVVLNAPKGTHVLTAEETAQLQGSKAPKYRYKKGTGFFSNLWSNVKGVAGNIGNKLKNMIGDVWDYMSNPSKLAEKVLGGVGALEGLTKYPQQVGKGLLDKATKALTSKITDMFSASGGNLDLGVGTAGVYKYLADVAKSVMSKFPGFQVTSGYRPGDPYSHGKRNAIDIALPGVTGGSPKYTEAANYAFEKFAGKVGYVITNGKVRDRSGQSGTGIHNNWTGWPDGDHYDHVHINGIKDPQNTQISGENIGGSGVQKWAGIATQALRMTGQYSPANLNALLNQMRIESNGNPMAINNWDINAKNGTPSKGLLQVIDPTFRAYAMPGHNTNIYDPLSNILASIRYALSRYGSLTNAYRGVGYENGGIIKKQHMAMVGEGNKEEVVIPLTGSGLKRSRAMQLLAYANEKLNRSQSLPAAGTTSSTNSDMAQMLLLLQQQNELLMAILAKDTNVVLDGEKLNSKLQKIQSRNQLNADRNLGLI